LGLTLQKIFWYDLKIEKNLSFALATFPPLIFYFLGFNRFLPVISLVGGIFLGIDGILILSMYQKHLKSQISNVKSLFVYSLILVFLGGIIYEIIHFSK
jgi:hypothetical protein